MLVARLRQRWSTQNYDGGVHFRGIGADEGIVSSKAGLSKRKLVVFLRDLSKSSRSSLFGVFVVLGQFVHRNRAERIT